MISSGLNEMSNLISAGYLPCVTMSNRKTYIEYKQFAPLGGSDIVFDEEPYATVDIELQSSSSKNISEDDYELKQSRRPKQTTYINAVAGISSYIANIKGI
jgi:hypothetical protein